jgi:hypothetical protein
MDGRIDFAINLVSLEKIGQSSDTVMIARLNILNNIQSREKDILSLFILGHCRDVRLENFYNVLTILRGLSAYTTPVQRREHNEPLQCPVPRTRVRPYFRL